MESASVFILRQNSKNSAAKQQGGACESAKPSQKAEKRIPTNELLVIGGDVSMRKISENAATVGKNKLTAKPGAGIFGERTALYPK